MYTARYQNEPKIQICIYTYPANSRMYNQIFLYIQTTLVCTHQFAFAGFQAFSCLSIVSLPTYQTLFMTYLPFFILGLNVLINKARLALGLSFLHLVWHFMYNNGLAWPSWTWAWDWGLQFLHSLWAGPEWTCSQECTTMDDGWCMDKVTFFHWVLKLGFIKLDALKKAKQGWCVHGCWVTLALGLCFLHTRTDQVMSLGLKPKRL